MSFQLSPEVDKNKIFLVKLSELEGRLDPHFYKPFFRNVVRDITNAKFTTLGNIVKFSNESWKQKELFEETFPYIEIGKIDLLTGEIKEISELEVGDAPSRAKMVVRSGDILVSTTRPSRGAISFLSKDGVFVASTGFSVIRELKTVDIDKYYLFYWLRQNHSLWQMEQRSSGGNYPAITQEELSNIKIPIPPKKVQSKIVAKMDTAYATKKQKEAEAQRLLDGIDGYLLGELGIELPKQSENTLQSRIFIRQLSEVSGGRFDADFHLLVYKNFDMALHNSKYKIKRIADISVTVFQGVSRKLTNNTSHILLKVKNIYKNNKIDFKNVEFIDLNDKRKMLKTGDIISPFIGEAIRQYKFSVFPLLPEKYTVDNNTGVIRLLPNINSIFIGAFLMSPCGKWQLDKSIGGGGVPFIGSFNAKKLKIPLPPLEKQTKIANHITKIRNQAKLLQQQAKEGLEQAKKAVEAMILGEDNSTKQ